ncbi:hypothetical protein MMC16_006617 [Acarospora aff. strigata]|nr:hypothetical protein [Acarospora aff. strigata]
MAMSTLRTSQPPHYPRPAPLARCGRVYTSSVRLWPRPSKEVAAAASRNQSRQAARPNRTSEQQASDPSIEQEISKLLSSMRQASVAGAIETSSAPQRDNIAAQVGRAKKDEEDERLLASEEGKKLSRTETVAQ